MPARATALLTLIVAACAATDDAGSLHTTDTLPNGAPHITVAAGARERVPEWRLVEDLRIGSVDDAGPTSFGDLRSIAVDDEGRIFALDAQAQEIRVFSADGAHLRTVGRKGAGPNEFQRANGLAAGPDGAIHVYDQANQRLTTVRSGGDSITMQQLESSSYGWVWGGIVDTAGRILETIRVMGREGSFVRRFDPTTARADTIELVFAASEAPVVVSARSARGGSMTLVGYTPVPLRRFDPDGTLWASFSRDYSIARRSLETGDTLMLLTFDTPGVPVTDAERAAEIARIDSVVAPHGGTWEHSLVPATKPPIVALATDARGRLWVRIASPDSLTRFDVFGPEGRLIATATTPLDFSTYDGQLVFHEDAVYAIVRDELDVPYIVRVRIPGQ